MVQLDEVEVQVPPRSSAVAAAAAEAATDTERPDSP